MKRVLILCTGNSCRSQMAERIWQQLGGGGWEAFSAGSNPSGYVHPLALKALEEIGLSAAGLRSKHVDEYMNTPMDLAITVCDNAREACPVFPKAAQKLHWPFDDPADATGDDEEKMKSFRRVRDEIKMTIFEYLAGQMSKVPFDAATQADGLKLFEMALVEDLGVADLVEGVCCTTDAVVPLNRQASAAFVSRQSGVISGLEVCKLAVAKWAPELRLECRVQDGGSVVAGQTIAILSGDAHRILVIERTCLNFLCRLSGISSLTKQFTELVAGSGAEILDTRKTAPGWRRLEKYAVACGGGANHRMGLYDAVMIKDNHLAFMQSEVPDKSDAIPVAIERARKWIGDHVSTLPNGLDTILQIEVDTLEQLRIALTARPDIVLLDNMNNEQLSKAVAIRNEAGPGILLEASGGVNLQTVAGIADTGVERISVGALTHSARNFDIGLDWAF